MLEQIKQCLLGRIEQEWKSLPGEFRPWGVWIRYYAPIGADIQYIGADIGVPLQAWFLDKNGLGERSIWEYQRFQVVHGKKPWCGAIWPEASLPASKGPHAIGQAAFAQYVDNSGFYLDWSLGGFEGRGLRVKFDERGAAIDYEGLWIS